MVAFIDLLYETNKTMSEMIKPRKKRVLIDMDGPLANLNLGLYYGWDALWPEDQPEKILQRECFWLDDMDDFVENADDKSKIIWQAEGFFESLEPEARGLGITAMREMVKLGHEVYIATSAGYEFTSAASEKFEWVKRYLGIEWLGKIVIAHHKNVVDGDYLIDDLPFPNGEDNGASWEHIVYDMKINRRINDPYKNELLQKKRRLNWQNWKSALPDLRDI
jgi:5'(3')-deoxyribonucleotidase